MIYLLSYVFNFSAYLFGLFLNKNYKMRLTTDEKKYAILGSPVRVQRAWRTKYKSKYAPNGSTITAIIEKYEFLVLGIKYLIILEIISLIP